METILGKLVILKSWQIGKYPWKNVEKILKNWKQYLKNWREKILKNWKQFLENCRNDNLEKLDTKLGETGRKITW